MDPDTIANMLVAAFPGGSVTGRSFIACLMRTCPADKDAVLGMNDNRIHDVIHTDSDTVRAATSVK